MKAFPPLNVTTSSLNLDIASEPEPDSLIQNIETFWQGINLYFDFSIKVVDAGGICYNYIYFLGNNSFSFTTTSQFPGKTTAEVVAFMQPLYDDLNRIGIALENPTNISPRPYGSFRQPATTSPVNTRYRSRLYPRKNWEDKALFNKTMAAIRQAVEAGYTYHGIPHGPSLEVAGRPGHESAVNPAWRVAAMHASLMTIQPVGLTAREARDEEQRIGQYAKLLRDVTPGSGAYINEADPGEPNWQQAFFGDNYQRLLAIKRNRDPWGLFWERTGVGSERWEVMSADGYPNSQNGRLCMRTRSTDN